MRADPGRTTGTGATLIWWPPFGFTGTTSFQYMAAEQVGSGPRLAKISNFATVTVAGHAAAAPPIATATGARRLGLVPGRAARRPRARLVRRQRRAAGLPAAAAPFELPPR